MKPQVLILPGLDNSGPEHWQSRWEKLHPEYRRVEQADWERPNLEDRVDNLQIAVENSRRPGGPQPGSGSLEQSELRHPAKSRKVKRGITGIPQRRRLSRAYTGDHTFIRFHATGAPLPFLSIMLYSEDDPYVSPERARYFGEARGSRIESVGARGHINHNSGLGDWPEGQKLLSEL